MKISYLFLAEGFEEIEGLTVVDLLRRAGIETITVSVMGREEIIGSHRIPVTADTLIGKVHPTKEDMLVLPGGMPGTLHLGDCEGLKGFLMKAAEENGRIAAICAAPSIFGHRGILQGKRACSYPCFEDHLEGAAVTAGPVEVDGNVITSRGMGTSIPFGLAIAGVFCGQNKADACAHGIVYQP